jgi:hypothetical protein
MSSVQQQRVVLEQKKRLEQTLGKEVSLEKVRHWRVNRSGYQVCSLLWSEGIETEIDTSGRMVAFRDSLVGSHSKNKSSLRRAMSQKEALQKAIDFSAKLGVPVNVNQLTESRLLLPPNDQTSKNEYSFRQWFFRFTKYVDDLPVLVPGVGVFLDADTGDLVGWSNSSEIVQKPSQQRLISVEKARMVADEAFKSISGIGNVEPKPYWLAGSSGWLQVALYSPIHRLAHQYVYNIVQDGELQRAIEIVVDAESGEVWRARNILVSENVGMHFEKVKTSSLVLMATALLQQEKYRPLGRVLTTATETSPLPSEKLENSDKITVKMDGKDVIWNVSASWEILTWRENEKVISVYIPESERESLRNLWWGMTSKGLPSVQ